MNYYGSDEWKEDCKVWADPDSWHKLCHFMTLFIDNKIPSPHYYRHLGAYEYETPRWLNKLRTLNNNGFLTVNGQPGLVDDDEILRGYLDLYIPIVNLNEVLIALKSYNLFILITVVNPSCKQALKADYGKNICAESETKEESTYLIAFDAVKIDSDFWEGHLDKRPESNPALIPLTLGKHKGYSKWETDTRQWITGKKFREDFDSAIFNDIKNTFEDHVVNMVIIDRQWKDGDPDYIFDIMVDVSTTYDLNIHDLEFKNRKKSTDVSELQLDELPPEESINYESEREDIIAIEESSDEDS